MNEVTYSFYNGVYVVTMCDHHTKALDGTLVYLSVTPVDAGTCGECESERASFDADKRAERRNEQVLSGDW